MAYGLLARRTTPKLKLGTHRISHCCQTACLFSCHFSHDRNYARTVQMPTGLRNCIDATYCTPVYVNVIWGINNEHLQFPSQPRMNRLVLSECTHITAIILIK